MWNFYVSAFKYHTIAFSKVNPKCTQISHSKFGGFFCTKLCMLTNSGVSIWNIKLVLSKLQPRNRAILVLKVKVFCLTWNFVFWQITSFKNDTSFSKFGFYNTQIKHSWSQTWKTFCRKCLILTKWIALISNTATVISRV